MTNFATSSDRSTAGSLQMIAVRRFRTIGYVLAWGQFVFVYLSCVETQDMRGIRFAATLLPASMASLFLFWLFTKAALRIIQWLNTLVILWFLLAWLLYVTDIFEWQFLGFDAPEIALGATSIYCAIPLLQALLANYVLRVPQDRRPTDL
jgi:hypothetical protein